MSCQQLPAISLNTDFLKVKCNYVSSVFSLNGIAFLVNGTSTYAYGSDLLVILDGLHHHLIIWHTIMFTISGRERNNTKLSEEHISTRWERLSRLKFKLKYKQNPTAVIVIIIRNIVYIIMGPKRRTMCTPCVCVCHMCGDFILFGRKAHYPFWDMLDKFHLRQRSNRQRGKA